MKINLVLGHQLAFPPAKGGGVENLTWMLAKQFVQKGHQVVAYSRLTGGLAGAEVDQWGVRHVRVVGFDRRPNVWLDHVNALRYALKLWPILEPADVTSFHTPFSFILRYKRGVGVCTHTIHRTPKWIVRLYRGMDRLYGGSNAVIEQALAIDASLKSLKRIYNCISVPDSPPPARTDHREGLLFMYVGRFVPDKGLAALIQGFHQSLRDFPKNRLEMVGPQSGKDGADESFFATMRAYVDSHGLKSAIELTPPIFDRARLVERIQSADVVCVPTIAGETFSMAILEAMALGKPILTSDFPPMLEAVDHRVNGYVSKRGDPESVAEGVRYFSKLGPEIDTMSRAAFKKVKECFSDERISDEYLADFRSLIAEQAQKRRRH
jgi:glycosyltransferase involved in cell wall biosynthesis